MSFYLTFPYINEILNKVVLFSIIRVKEVLLVGIQMIQVVTACQRALLSGE